MAAGLGFKTFTTGEVLTAADTNGYLMQGVLVFASAAARDAAITSPQEGQCCYLKDTDAVLTYSGAAWVGFDDSNAIQNTIVDAKGDLIAATAADTPARLAVGTDGQYLSASSGAATGLAWATASPSGFVFIKSQTFTNVASVDIDSAFSSTYTNYKVIFQNFYAATATDDLYLQWRYGSTTQATSYYATSTAQASTAVITQTANAAQLTVAAYIGAASQPGSFDVTMMGMGVAAGNIPFVTGLGYAMNDTQGFWFAGSCNTSQTWSGFRLKSSSTNITGKVLIYGMVNA